MFRSFVALFLCMVVPSVALKRVKDHAELTVKKSLLNKAGEKDPVFEDWLKKNLLKNPDERDDALGAINKISKSDPLTIKNPMHDDKTLDPKAAAAWEAAGALQAKIDKDNAKTALENVEIYKSMQDLSDQMLPQVVGPIDTAIRIANPGYHVNPGYLITENSLPGQIDRICAERGVKLTDPYALMACRKEVQNQMIGKLDSYAGVR